LKKYEYNKERKQFLVGKVVSVKCLKSILVEIRHDRYIKKYNAFKAIKKKIMAHDENELGRLDDLVRIVPCRPMSRRKRHSLIDIISRPPGVEDRPRKPLSVKTEDKKVSVNKI
jgi:small subunit ribosomal protein S17